MIAFEPIVPAHAALVFEAWRDPALYAYIDDAPPPSVEALAARFARWATGAPADEVWLNWLIRDDGAPAGHLQTTIYPHEARAVIAYVVFTAHQRRGVASAAVAWLLEELARRGVAIAEAVIDVKNAASLRVVERHGFQREAVHGADATYRRRVR